MSVGLQDAELNYPDIDKRAYAVYKAVKHFRPYILKNHVTVFVPHPTVLSLFVQQELSERWGNWMACLQEYDLEFKLAHNFKGKGLCWMATEAADLRGNEDECWDHEIDIYQANSTPQQSTPSCYVYL